MKQNVMLTVASLLTILFMTFHLGPLLPPSSKGIPGRESAYATAPEVAITAPLKVPVPTDSLV